MLSQEKMDIDNVVDVAESMFNREEMDIDSVVVVPDTPDRVSAQRLVTDSESVGSKTRDTFYENHMNGLRSIDKFVPENGRGRKKVIKPPKGFRTADFGIHNVISSIENSSGSQNAHMFRRVDKNVGSGHRARQASGVRNMDKGKTICTDMSSNFQDSSRHCDFPKQSGNTERGRTVCLYGPPNNIFAEDKRKGQTALSENSSGALVPDASKTRNASKGKEKIDEHPSKCSDLDMIRREVINLSPDSEHKTREHNKPSHSVTPFRGRTKSLVRGGCISPQNVAKMQQVLSSSKNVEQSDAVTPLGGRTKGLVIGGCISPQNVAKMQQLSNSSKNVEQSDAGNGVYNCPQPVVDIRDIIAEENSSSERVKGKAVFTIPDTPNEQKGKSFRAASSSFATSTGEVKGVGNGSRDESGCSQGLGGWRNTHSNLRKLDNRNSRQMDGHRNSFHHDRRIGSRQNSQTECGFAEGLNQVLAPPSVCQMELSRGPPRAETILTKRLKKQGSPSRNHGECSTSISEDSDVLCLGSSMESTNTRTSRLHRSRSRVISGQDTGVNVLSSPVRNSSPQILDCTNNDDSDDRARQVEADEMLARELQEQLYHEVPIIGGSEIDEHFARALQRQEISTSGAGQNEPYLRGSEVSQLQRQPRSRSSQNRSNRTQNPPNRRLVGARAPTSSRMAQLRSRMYRQHFNVSNRGRTIPFPLDMDLDMRLDILEALEAAVGDLNEGDMGNHIYQVQRDFNENDYEMLLALDEQNHQHAGASAIQINTLPQSVVQTENLDEACAICLESPSVGDTIRHLPCFHKFHKDCIDPWLTRKASCPVCKCSIT
ncbi:uncharacterized protein LOC115722783 isoform X1 [Cannabis sativa]|uniref:uncharacterized protein LOC115722783 isoform X1 n=1 Tax=Cannabis sativa TaxID=3483 RepID=UPI0029CA99BA|nr:uncharacterized protein LOC115722783 isoform X1 [Cannabis sativa]XP_030507957.2 uncharacterized protein LOC115722783 isoform X1 [Cannabis sativa]